MENHHKDLILMLADNSMILGQRLGEWCGHGPVLEQDIAITNIALDLIGEARLYYQYIAGIEGKSEDDYPMHRDVRKFKNILLVEQPNGHWGDTIVRQFLFDVYHCQLAKAMAKSHDTQLAAIAKKTIKEATYHLAFSSEWLIRLGDGTDESHQKVQASLNHLYPFFGEFFVPCPYELDCIANGVLSDLTPLKQSCEEIVSNICTKATLNVPTNTVPRIGGKTGMHMEYLGYILAEMQYLQKVHPGAQW
jgi:ring-1,2-phenylacetyl-CoA epoxidase subunit PaaC